MSNFFTSFIPNNKTNHDIPSPSKQPGLQYVMCKY